MLIESSESGVSLLRLLTATAVVFGLLAGFAFVLKYINLKGWRLRLGNPAQSSGLSLKNILQIDARRKLLVIEFKGSEHLLLVGGPQDLVITSQPCLSLPKSDNVPNHAAPPPLPHAAEAQPTITHASHSCNAASPAPPQIL